MKKAFFLLVFSSLSSFASPDIVVAPVKHLYLPHGFDSNDAVEVVVTGEFPNTCYSRNDVKVKVSEETIDISITAANHEKIASPVRCAEMIVPFKEVVHVGNLQGGKYKVRVNEKTRFLLEDEFTIQEASSNSVDDHIYAAIEWVEKKSDKEFVLHGWRYSNCIDLEKIEVVSNKKDTISILPVMKQLSSFCPMKMMPTAYSMKLDLSELKMKQPLLHVRTMDGKSVNSIVDLEERR
jgi:hypothetical protein